MKSEKDWLNKVAADISELPNFLAYFGEEADKARSELSLKGRIEDHSKNLPVVTELRFTQLQIINAMVRHFEIQLEKERSRLYRKYLEKYDRTLTSRDAEKFVDGEEEVVALNLVINEICQIRNIFTSIVKSLEIKGFQINNIVKLRAAGLDDAKLE